MGIKIKSRYYTELDPFRELFALGLPILTYHKVAKRPWRARLRGLYVSPALFAKQLAELRAAGYSTRTLPDDFQAPAGYPSQIVLTFDDGFRNVWENALNLLEQNKFHATVFLVADRLGRTNDWETAEGEVVEPLMDETQVREWLAAGHRIGAHTLTHPRLTSLSPDQAREEIFASKRKLEDRFGVEVADFCFPYGERSLPIQDLVTLAGYRTACTEGFGVNQRYADPLALKRIPARHRTRSLKPFLQKLKAGVKEAFSPSPAGEMGDEG